MDENKQFYDLYGYQINPMEWNNWMLYQQPYFNVSSFDPFGGNFGINYENMSLQNTYHSYSSNVNHGPFNNNIHLNNNVMRKAEIVKYKNNNFNESVKSDQISKHHGDHSTLPKSNLSKPIKHENKQAHVNFCTQPFEILNRNKKGDEEKFRKAFTYSPKIDLDKDFPPISNVTHTEKAIEHDKSLDYRLALQKPVDKKIDITDNCDQNVEKVQKKRKKRRKKKITAKPVEPFSLIEEEFPTLDDLKVKEKVKDPLEVKCDIDISPKPNKTISLIEKKRSKRRQLLFLLPADLEGQVTVVRSPFPQKNKNKRNRKQDRLKKPIGMLNPLDLSAPSVKRGKERLKPKAKKHSKLKKTILHYRKLKKELREKASEETVGEIGLDKLNINPDKPEPSQPKTENNVSKIHSKHFREYCNHMIDNKINAIISQLLKTLVGFQDKLYNRDPLKAKLKRRLCFGLREVTKYVNMKKLRLIIIAPDLEKIDIKGGLDDIVNVIIKGARESGIPYVFGLSRSSLAYLCYKKFRVGAIGIFNYDGAETQVKDLLTSVDKAREQYSQIKQIMESISQDVIAFATSLNINPCSLDQKCDFPQHSNSVPYNAGHSRTPSNALSEPISDIGEMNKLLFNSIVEDQAKSTDSESVNKECLITEDSDGDIENVLIDEYVENILLSVSRLNLDSPNL